MSCNNRSVPTGPGHRSEEAAPSRPQSNSDNQREQARRNSNGGKSNGFFSGGNGNGIGGFDFNQFSQNISNSLQDILSNNNIFNEPLMDVRKMLYKSCNSCGTSFSVFMRKKRCQICMLHFCHSCMELSNQRTYRCRRCLVFAETPLTKDSLNTLRVRDLKWFLSNRNISAETYSEKRELIELIIANVNPPPPPPPPPSQSQSSRRGSATSAGHSQQSSQRQPTPQPRSAPQSQQTSPQTELPPPTQPEQPNSTPSPPPAPPEPMSTNEHISSSLSSSYPELPKPSSYAKNVYTNLNISTFNLNDIKEENDIKELSIRQLKLILTRNFVDFRGCVEREELIEKAVRLWHDRQQSNKLRDENEDNLVIDENMCKICMENIIDCVLLECGHMLTCTNCGKKLNECPICRQFVTRVVHVFKS